MKLLGPPTIAELVPLSTAECSRLIDTQMFVTEHGAHLPLRQGEEITYTYVAVGQLHRTHDDVTCYGDTGYFDDSAQSSMVQTKSIAIRVDQVTLHEHDGSWYDAAAETFLPPHCDHQRTCLAFGRTYIWTTEKDCTLFRTRSLQVLQGQATEGVLDRKVVHSPRHQLVLRLDDDIPIPGECEELPRNHPNPFC